MTEFITVCTVDELQPGQREVFDIDGRWVAVFNVDNKYYAIEDLCTHDGNVLTEDENGEDSVLDGYEIECPRHGARFDIRDGSVKAPPALVPVPWYQVRIDGDEVQVEVK